MTAETPLDTSLRPTGLADFVGQTILKNHLSVILGAAKARGEAASHLLFSGPAGLGKTSLASVIATEMGTKMVQVFAPALTEANDLVAILLGLEEGDVLFVDEIHALSRSVSEMFYTAVEDFRLDVIIGKGSATQSVQVPLNRFTLVGATTHPGLLPAPLRDRFGFTGKLDYYSTTDLTALVTRSALILGMTLDFSAAAVIAARSRGVPRIANRLLSRVRDYADYAGISAITWEAATTALELFGVDSLGLDRLDREILTALTGQFGGAPVGLANLAEIIGEEPSTLEDVQEPYLVRLGLVIRTPRGRRATAAAYRHLGLPVPLIL